MGEYIKKRVKKQKFKVTTWEKMENMSKKFFPPHYIQELYVIMENIKKGDTSVEQYIEEFDMLLIQSHVDETTFRTMDRFV